MAGLQAIERIVLRDTLLSIPAVAALVELEGAPGEYKIFWLHVEPDIALPYIVMTHLSGGWEHKTTNRASDSIWKIVGVTSNMDTAEAMGNAIGELDGMLPVVTGVADIVTRTDLEEILPLSERKPTENTPNFAIGGYYRLCLSHS